VRIKGRGVASLRGGKGDHYVRIKVDIPKNLSAKEKKLYEELKDASSKKKSWF
ncbi:MAG: Chaperone protein DnaJ, partial [Candidatus Daviesbacteria bacterium GW2011_GWA1_38_7]